MIALILMFGLMIALAIAAVAGIVWAGSTGQFRNMEQGATVIFDLDEPVGKATDQVLTKRTTK